jgi:uncharacterized membrane protein
MATRVLYSRMLIALLALLGLLDAAYLTLEHYRPQVALVCPLGGGCETVQASRWSTLPPGNGVPVAALGICGYGLLVVVALAGLHRERIGPLPLAPLLLALASLGVIVSAFLVGLQAFVIGAYCTWCLASAALEALCWLAALAGWREWRAGCARSIAKNERAAGQRRALS